MPKYEATYELNDEMLTVQIEASSMSEATARIEQGIDADVLREIKHKLMQAAYAKSTLYVYERKEDLG